MSPRSMCNTGVPVGRAIPPMRSGSKGFAPARTHISRNWVFCRSTPVVPKERMMPPQLAWRSESVVPFGRNHRLRTSMKRSDWVSSFSERLVNTSIVFTRLYGLNHTNLPRRLRSSSLGRSRRSTGGLASAHPRRPIPTGVRLPAPSKSSRYAVPRVLRFGRLCAISPSRRRVEGSSLSMNGSMSTAVVIHDGRNS
ncbi:MAG: hypothetical protein BWY06_03013 [Candidatus Latescibacteria bacterium ADurb.Bin168]|nr:MAG: hypothetical protein BWY06_03013 [Candidatus Latescibacteria bacterium ADurb.Bin168]